MFKKNFKEAWISPVRLAPSLEFLYPALGPLGPFRFAACLAFQLLALVCLGVSTCAAFRCSLGHVS